MGWSTVFKYFGLAMEAANAAANAYSEVAHATDPNSPGGTAITESEKHLV